MLKDKKIKIGREEEKLKSLISLVGKKAVPGRKFKEKLFFDLMENSCLNVQNQLSTSYGLLEKLFFEKPWRFAIPLSLAISIIFRISAGSMFDKFIFSLFAGI